MRLTPAWSTSALALALGESQRNVQRALATLEAAGQVRAIGRARAQRVKQRVAYLEAKENVLKAISVKPSRAKAMTAETNCEAPFWTS